MERSEDGEGEEWGEVERCLCCGYKVNKRVPLGEAAPADMAWGISRHRGLGRWHGQPLHGYWHCMHLPRPARWTRCMSSQRVRESSRARPALRQAPA